MGSGVVVHRKGQLQEKAGKVLLSLEAPRGHWSVQDHWRMQSQPFPGSWTGRQQPEPQTWRSNPCWHSSATLGIHTHEASPCKPLAPPSRAAAPLAPQEGFPSWLQVSTSRHRTQSVSVDIPPLAAAFCSPSKCPFHLALIISREHSAPELCDNGRH